MIALGIAGEAGAPPRPSLPHCARASWRDWGFILALALLPHSSFAAGNESFLKRDTMTGDWGGAREWLGDHGVNVQMEFTGFFQGLFAGSGHSAFEPGGRADGLINFDSGKLGLWEGGGFHTHIEYRFGNLSPFLGGALWPQNTAAALPLGAKDEVVASSLYFSQRFGDSASLLLGKINAVDLLAKDPFFGGWGTHRFMNVAFVAPPSGVLPPVIVGGILKYQMDPFGLTLMVYDPDDYTNDYGTDHLFSNGVNVSLAGSWSGKLFDRPTSLALTGIYSTRDGADVEEFLLPPDLKTSTEEGSYSVSLQFGHLLLESPVQPGKGLGVYMKGGIADGNPNPIQANFIAGFAGHGIVPSRPRDSFGIGYYFYNFSNDLQSTVAPVVDFNDEQGMEIFYNLALTPWFRLMGDLQVIDPASGSNATAAVGGLRANLVF